MTLRPAVEPPHRTFVLGATVDPDRACSGLSQLGEIGTWWDPDTKTLVASVMYAYGGCMCGEQTDTFVKRL
jgi:hypothetical protein